MSAPIDTRRISALGRASIMVLAFSGFMSPHLHVLAFSVPKIMARPLPSSRTDAIIWQLKMTAPASEAASEAASQQMQQSLAVAIDQPLVVFDRMSPVTGKPLSPSPETPNFGFDWPATKKVMTGILASNSFRTSIKVTGIALCMFLVFFLITKTMKAARSKTDPAEVASDNNTLVKACAIVRSSLAALSATANKRLQRLREKFRKRPEVTGFPMPFDYDSDNEGWGVCTLRSKRRLGRSSFVQYEFDLPEPDYVLPLDLGQQVSLCCLDSTNNVAKGEFFPYNAETKKRLGSFSILAPNRTPPENEFAIGDDAANFVRVLKQDLKVGDEIALKPGKDRLGYRGQYLPVTDMVYIACGTGDRKSVV